MQFMYSRHMQTGNAYVYLNKIAEIFIWIYFVANQRNNRDIVTDLWRECRVDGCSGRICFQHLPAAVAAAAAAPLPSVTHNHTSRNNTVCKRTTGWHVVGICDL